MQASDAQRARGSSALRQQRELKKSLNCLLGWLQKATEEQFPYYEKLMITKEIKMKVRIYSKKFI